MSALTKASLIGAGVVTAGLIGLLSPPSHPAQAAERAHGEQCFNKDDINGFNAPNDRTLYIRVGVSDIYRLDLSQGCQGLPFREVIGVRSVPPGDPFICSAIQAEVVYRETGMAQSCQVDAMHKLSLAERAGVPKRDLP